MCDDKQIGKYLVACSDSTGHLEMVTACVMAIWGGTFREWAQDCGMAPDEIFEHVHPKPGWNHEREAWGMWVFEGWCAPDREGQWSHWGGKWRRPTAQEWERIMQGQSPWDE